MPFSSPVCSPPMPDLHPEVDRRSARQRMRRRDSSMPLQLSTVFCWEGYSLFSWQHIQRSDLNTSPSKFTDFLSGRKCPIRSVESVNFYGSFSNCFNCYCLFFLPNGWHILSPCPLFLLPLFFNVYYSRWLNWCVNGRNTLISTGTQRNVFFGFIKKIFYLCLSSVCS